MSALSRIFGGSRNSQADKTKKAFERQVVSLQKAVEVVTQHDNDRRQWAVGIQLKNGPVIVCYILLAHPFPESPPVFELSMPCDHPWIDPVEGRRIVGHPKLAAWESYYDLGGIAKDVINELTTRPPQPRSEQQRRTAQSQPQQHQQPRHHQYQQQLNQQNHQHRQHRWPQVKLTEPSAVVDVPASFPAIEKASIEGLQHMNNDSAESKKSRELFIIGHEFVKNRISRRKELRQGCKALAEKNVTAAMQLEQLRNEIDELDQKITERKAQLQGTFQRQKELASYFSNDAAIQSLQVTRDRLDMESMDLSDSFLADREADDEAFCQNFLAQRTAYHETSGIQERLRSLQAIK